MRVAQVVSYVAADGAFGGPVAVALAQCVELARQGHEVELWAGWDGRAELDAPGVVVHLFRTHRRGALTTMIAPRLLLALHSRRRRYDVLHLHLGRDLLSLTAWLAVASRRRAVVLQPHGMVMPDRRLKSRVADAVVVRSAFSSAKAVLALTEAERKGILTVAGRRRPRSIELLGNGIPMPANPVAEPRSDDVVFIARLHPRKGVLRFAEAAKRLLRAGWTGRFLVYGPDEGDLPALMSFIAREGLTDGLRYEGPLAPALVQPRLARSAAYVLPSVGEVVPMTVLEALAVGTPVIITRDCGLADALEGHEAGLVVEPDAEAVSAAIERLVRDPEYAATLASNGRRLLRDRFSIEAVAGRLLQIYADPTGKPGALT